jgi:cytochrome oxidase Cu insertion factor (SCO1/SenC/PrrC family)
MRSTWISALTLVVALALTLPTPQPLMAQADGTEIGETVPDFTLPDTYGNDHSIADYRGKHVVLEWLNYRCPSVVKHYRAGNMQMLQEKYTGEGD